MGQQMTSSETKHTFHWSVGSPQGYEALQTQTEYRTQAQPDVGNRHAATGPHQPHNLLAEWPLHMFGKGCQTAIPLDDGFVYALSIEIVATLHIHNIKRGQVRLQFVTVQLLLPRHMCQGREHNSKNTHKHSQEAHGITTFLTSPGKPKYKSKYIHPQKASACQQLVGNWCDDNFSGWVHLSVGRKLKDAPPNSAPDRQGDV